MKRFALASLLLIGLIGLLYAPAGSFEFLRLDDHDYTFRCAFVFDGLSWPNVKEAFANIRHGGVWMPLTYISYMIDISLWGAGAGPHHWANVLLHMLNAVLLLAFAHQLAKARKPGSPLGWICLATAFWALHPQRVEAVAWIASRKELLWAMFTLAGLMCWMRRSRAATGKAALAWTDSAYVCHLLACLSKPTAMCFPVLAVCVDWLQADTASRDSADGRPRSLRQQAIAYLPLVAMAIGTGALAIYSQTHAEGYDARTLFSASLPWRLLNAAVAVGLYLFQTVVPAGIHLDYRAVPGQFPLHGLLGLATLGLACLALGAGAWRNLRRASTSPHRPAARAAIAAIWFVAALLPTLGVFGSFGEHARADRFLYVPAMAIPVLAALFPPPGARLLQSIGWCLVVILAVASCPVIASYRNDYTAFMRTLAFDPDNGRALAHVASEECARYGKIDRGIDHFRKSQAIRPRDDTAAQLAYALAMRGHSGDFAEIRRLCGKFACDHRLDAKGQALEALGMTAMRQRRWKEAIGLLEDSIRAPRRFYSPDDAKLRLAAAYCNSGRIADAVRTLEPLTQSRRADIQGKARQALDTLRTNPRAVLFLD